MSDIILFDLDGTLTDSGPGIMKSVQYALQTFGISEQDSEKLRQYVGPPLLDSFMEFHGLTKEQAEEAITKYRERYETTGLFENELYEGIPEILEALKNNGKILAVASSKPEVYVEKILEHFGIRSYFSVVTGSELDGSRTKKAEVIEETLRRLDVLDNRTSVVMVGDRRYDVEGAKESGLLCVGAAYGYGGRKELKKAGAAWICDTPEELKILLENPEQEKKRRAHIRKMRPERIPWLSRNESGTGIFAASEKESSRKKRSPKGKTDLSVNGISWKQIAWRIVKPLVTYELFLIGGFVIMALIQMSFMTGGYLETRMYQSSVFTTALASLASLPVLWKQYQGDEGMFPPMEKNWGILEGAACVLLLISFGHLLNILLDAIGFTKTFSGYQTMAEQVYQGQNPFLLVLSVGILSAVAEELVFRGMIYRRAKDFWGTGWAIAISSLLFGIYHGNITQFVYASLAGVLLVLVYERCGTLLAPMLAHMAENIWGLYRNSVLSFLSGKNPSLAWIFVLFEAACCVAAFWYLFLRGKNEKKRKKNEV